ncbi:MAG TPA: hypothetical protein VIY10_24035 [Solirubrobacteraceae bacterium]|jgi:hypothetical protein
MSEHQSSRTLVKSAPELWAECSDAASLARHLGAFGEIRITKLEPETAVAWEGAAASGTVRLESSGWGTRVTLTVTEEGRPAEPVEPVGPVEPVEPVEPVATEPEPEPVAMEPEPEPVATEPVTVDPDLVVEAAEPQAAQRAGRFARFRLAFRRRAAPTGEPTGEPSEPEPVAEEPIEPEPGPVAEAPATPEPAPEPPAPPQPVAPAGEEALVAALDSLGMAHHRPYSRA